MKSTETVQQDHAALDAIAAIRERSILQRLLASQPFWVTVALAALSGKITADGENVTYGGTSARSASIV